MHPREMPHLRRELGPGLRQGRGYPGIGGFKSSGAKLGIRVNQVA